MDEFEKVPDWISKEIRDTWRTAREIGSQLESFRVIERMVERLGYGRVVNNPTLSQRVMNEEFDDYWISSWKSSNMPPIFDTAMREIALNAWLEATRRAEEKSASRIGDLEAALTKIALYAHDNSTGPAVPDHLWEIRQIAYDTL